MTTQVNTNSTEYKPRFRQNVNIVRDSSDKYIVKDPESKALNYFVCNRLQLEVIKRLDGQTPLQSVAEQISRVFKTEVPLQNISNFVVSLDKQALLEPESTHHLPDKLAKKAAKKALKRLKSNDRMGLVQSDGMKSQTDFAKIDMARQLLSQCNPTGAARHLASALEQTPHDESLVSALEVIKKSIADVSPRSISHWPMISLFNPYPLLVRLNDLFGFVFTRWFTLLILISSLVSLTITIAYWDTIYNETFTWEAWRGPRIAIVVGIGILLTMLHEFGHGVACVHYGGKPKEMGVMLMFYIYAATYCDVSDLVLVNSRRARVVTYVAGVFATTILWCIVTPLWLISTPGSLLYDTLLLTSLFTGIENIRQFIPLFKFDGHFILASMAGHISLYEESLQHFRNTILGPVIHKFQQRKSGLFILFGLFNLVLVLLFSAFWFGFGSTIYLVTTVTLGYGILTLFIRSCFGPLNGATYDSFKRDFAIYAIIFIFVLMAPSVFVLWPKLVGRLKGYGMILVLYLLWRSLRRISRLVFCDQVSGQSIFTGDSQGWVPSVIFWFTIDMIAMGFFHWIVPIFEGEKSLIDHAYLWITRLISIDFWKVW